MQTAYLVLTWIVPAAAVFLAAWLIYRAVLFIAGLFYRHPIDWEAEVSLTDAYRMNRSIEQIAREGGE